MTSVNTHVISSKTNDRAVRVQGTHLLTLETMHFLLATAMVKITVLSVDSCAFTSIKIKLYLGYSFMYWRY